MEYSLQMTFACDNGEKTSLTIKDVKAGITKTEAFTLMDAIISNDIFATKNGSFVSKVSAQITEKQVTKHVA